MKVGYARTSSIDGSQRTGLETQIEILKRHGCERIFAEEQSGTSTDNRQQFKEFLEFMREGDEFTFTMVDRVCRNSYDLQVIVKDLTDIRSLHKGSFLMISQSLKPSINSFVE